MTISKLSRYSTVASLVAILVGALIGSTFPEIGKKLQLIGELFSNSLMVLVAPLIVSSIIVSVSEFTKLRDLTNLGIKTIGYYLVTTALAVTLSLLLVSVIQPGQGYTGQQAPGGEEVLAEPLDKDTFSFKEKSLHPKLAIPKELKSIDYSFNGVMSEIAESWIPHSLFEALVNNRVLPLIFASLTLGMVLSRLLDRGRAVASFAEGTFDSIKHIVNISMVVAPIGIGTLIAAQVGEVGGLTGVGTQLVGLSRYVATVIVALLIHSLITLPLILHFVGKQPIGTYVRNVVAALSTAFATGSSIATLPILLQSVTDKNNISERNACFVLSLGTTLNMDGIALYEAISAVFIAQVYGIDLGIGQLLIIFITATLAAVGTAGIPEAGLVTMALVLQAVHLPVEGIALILIVDWILSRFRAVVNVWSSAVGAAVIEQLETQTHVEDNLSLPLQEQVTV